MLFHLQQPMKRTIYHFNSTESHRGRAINALLGFLTANRYSLIFSLKCTIVKRNYNERRMRERVLDSLWISSIIAPIGIALMFTFEKCSNTPILPQTQEQDTINVCVPSLPLRDSIAHPHTPLKP